MKSIKRFISCFVVVSLMTTLIPVRSRAATTNLVAGTVVPSNITEPPAITNTQRTVSRIIGELIEKREANVKHFLKEDGSIEAAIYPNPVHFFEDGKWKDIDNSLKEEVVSSETFLSNAYNSFNVNFSKNSNSNKLVSVTKGKYSFALKLGEANNSSAEKTNKTDAEKKLIEESTDVELKRLNVSKESKESKILDENEKKKFLNKLGDGVSYLNVYNNTDIKYLIDSSKIKQTIVLKQLVKNPTVKLNIKANNLTVKKGEDGSIVFSDASDVSKTVFEMPKTFMVDANGAISDDVNLDLEESADGYTISIIPSTQWLSASTTQYPVQISP